jgi:hypothetical protein
MDFNVSLLETRYSSRTLCYKVEPRARACASVRLRAIMGHRMMRSGYTMTGQSPYNFDDQLAHGERGEALLDRFFSRWFGIEPATPEEQRRGIDRHFHHLTSHNAFTVEYKTDHTATRTGNAFIETVSVDTAQKAGWAFTSQADRLLYYVPGNGVVYVLKMATVRAQLPVWQRAYEVREVPNNGYHTHGLLVPLEELEQIAERVLACEE